MIERALERLIFASRWIMVPFYLGLILTLSMLLVKFAQELFHHLPHVLELSESDIILLTLALIDLTLAASLVLMVAFSGYESFVSKIDSAPDTERLAWMGTLDFGGMKLKLSASIVAISGIHLLKSFMNIGKIDRTELMMLAGVHLVFVVSGLLLAIMDWVTEKAKALEKH